MDIHSFLLLMFVFLGESGAGGGVKNRKVRFISIFPYRK